ncbi:MAG: PQQ-like beta-propeller repeat protein [Pirellulales bacterium]|nr:PQQ-like beta-propeller repeat protein [Pirellulales bacterium]
MLVLRLVFVGTLALASMAHSEVRGDDAAEWRQWRGPARDGQLAAGTLPDSLAIDRLVETWRVELGPGYPGPIVAGDRVFVAETRDERDEVVRALDRATGRQLWEVAWPGAMKVPFFAKRNGDWIRATPACDGQTLYVAGMLDVLVALDVVTGAERWRVDFPQQLKTAPPDFGFASSPLVVGDFVYVQAAGGFVKLDKHNGEVVWRTLDDGGGMWGSAFSSPVLANLAGREQLVVQTRTHLAGVEPERGEVLWKHEIEAFRGMNILTPTIWRDCVFTSAYGGKSTLLRIENDGAAQKSTVAWQQKTQGYMSSPVVVGDHVYLHLRNRRFTCIDLATGESPWTTTPFGEYWSLVAAGEMILALDQTGELLLIRANPEKFDLVERRKLSEEETWGHLAVAGDEIYVRELKALRALKFTRAGVAGAQPAAPAGSLEDDHRVHAQVVDRGHDAVVGVFER